MSIDIGVRQVAGNAIVGVDFVYPLEIDTEIPVYDNAVSVTLLSGRSWHPLYFTPGSALLTCTESIPFEGRIVENKFELKMPGSSPSLGEMIHLTSGRAIVLRLTFENGAQLLCGGKARKLRLTNLGTMGTQNGNVIGFVYRSRQDFKWISV